MILFRADGNIKIGMGHIMRCLSIADTFRRNGKDCTFVLADISMQDIISARKYKTVILGSDYQYMDEEIEKLKAVIKKMTPDMVIIDSYFVTKQYLECVKSMARLIYIDDLGAFAYPTDILINYNAYSSDIDYKSMYLKESVSYPAALLGVKYAPLRECFKNISAKNQNKKCKNILISTGGSDLIHLAVDFAKFMKGNKDTVDYHLLVGSMNPDKQEIHLLAGEISNLHIHFNVVDMKTLISSCDLAVTAAGSTMYEICACGVPMITYIIADNQIPGAKAFGRMGLAVSCGDFRRESNPGRKIYEGIGGLSKNYMQRVNMGKRMQRLVDGHGADRIVSELIV